MRKLRLRFQEPAWVIQEQAKTTGPEMWNNISTCLSEHCAKIILHKMIEEDLSIILVD